jgi:hypothetical protein
MKQETTLTSSPPTPPQRRLDCPANRNGYRWKQASSTFPLASGHSLRMYMQIQIDDHIERDARS